jgi:hypothetical protein
MRLSLHAIVARRHCGLRELAGIAVLYGFYELFRGMSDGSLAGAISHTSDIVALERALGVFVEREVQEWASSVPALPSLLGLAYVSLHFVATAWALVWIHRSHRCRFALVRTTLVVATAISLVVYVAYPAAPPRLAELGFADTVSSGTGLDLSSDLLGSFYNPIAAVPSMHFGYALIVGIAIAALARTRAVRLAGALYAPFILFVIVATGNHFLFDAVAGGLVVLASWVTARRLVTPAGRPAPLALAAV